MHEEKYILHVLNKYCMIKLHCIMQRLFILKPCCHSPNMLHFPIFLKYLDVSKGKKMEGNFNLKHN